MANKMAESITSRILEQLATGTAAWRKTWKGIGMPRNLISGKPYRGMNVFILMSYGFPDPRFLTYNQAKSKGGYVRAGEKGIPIIFWNFIDEMKDGNKTGRKIPLMRGYTVFNVSQCDNLKIPALGDEKREHTPIEMGEQTIFGMPGCPTIAHGGDVACYNPATDTVTLPKPEAFQDGESYYATAFHELAHSTGHPTRLGREFDGHFGSHKYTFEELIAEMTAAFLCAHCGIEDKTLDNSTAYINGWINTIKDRKSVV